MIRVLWNVANFLHVVITDPTLRASSISFDVFSKRLKLIFINRNGWHKMWIFLFDLRSGPSGFVESRVLNLMTHPDCAILSIHLP